MPGEWGDLIDIDFGGGGGGGGGFTPPSGGGDVNIPDVPDPVGGIPNVNPPNAGGGPSFKDITDAIGGVTKPAGDLAKSVAPFMSLATGGMGIASGITAAQRSAQQAALQRKAQRGQAEAAAATRAAAAPLTEFGREELARGQAGQIPPAIQARIDQWKQGFLAAARDRLAKMGQGDSQALMQWEQFAEQQAQAMAADYLQEEMRMGTQNLQAGAQTIASAGGQQGAVAQGANVQGDAIERLIEQANKTLSSLNAGAS